MNWERGKNELFKNISQRYPPLCDKFGLRTHRQEAAELCEDVVLSFGLTWSF